MTEYKIVSSTQSGTVALIGTGDTDEAAGIADAVIAAGGGGGPIQGDVRAGGVDVSRSVVRGFVSKTTRWTRNASRIFVPAKEKLWLPRPAVTA
jgi:hypothetical protein